MSQDASIMLATKSKNEVRELGAMERLFWLMDQKHPAHLTVTAEVNGFTKVQNWRDALDAVQRRHPILSTSINRNEEGQPADVDLASVHHSQTSDTSGSGIPKTRMTSLSSQCLALHFLDHRGLTQ